MFSMSFTKDSHDILQAGEDQPTVCSVAKSSAPQKAIKKLEMVKRPDGMHRELYNLLINSGGTQDTIHTLVPSATKKGYTNAKIQFGRRQVRKWEWRAFSNPGRMDNLQLKHWERVGENPNKVYPFARFNKQIHFLVFTETEYENYLQDSKWSRAETEHLLQLCRQFDNRWVVVDDRFDRDRFKSKKGMEDLKERYFNVVNELKTVRGIKDDQPNYSYDVDHEKRRKEQLVKLWERTEEDIKEEEDLKISLKRIELKRKEREKKACDLQRLINATERTSLSPDSSAAGGNTSVGSRNARRGNSRATPAVVAQLIAPTDQLNIRFHEFRTSGPHLRSQEMKLPTNIGQKKAKNIDTVIDKLKIDPNPYAFEEVVEFYNNFRSNIVLLQDLKTALHSAEGELEALGHRMKNEKGVALKIEPKMRVSDYKSEVADPPPRAKNAHKQPGDPATSRRVTNWIDVNPGGLSTARKRKVRQLSPSDTEATRNA